MKQIFVYSPLRCVESRLHFSQSIMPNHNIWEREGEELQQFRNEREKASFAKLTLLTKISHF